MPPEPQVQFEEEQQLQYAAQPQGGPGGLPGLLMRLGAAKDAQQANYILIGIAVVAAGIAIYFALPSSPKAPSIPSPAEMQIPGAFAP